MAHSFAQQANFTCLVCRQPFAADIWLIIHAAERPDLLARVHGGTIHRPPCPNGHPAGIDAPLLIFRPDEARPLLFSPAQGTTAEQDHQMAAGLLGHLAASLGDDWRDDWLAGVGSVPRLALPAVLDGADPEATSAAAMQASMPPAVVAALEEITAALAAEGVTLESTEDLERALAARPALREKLEAVILNAAPATAGAPPLPPATPTATPATPNDPLLTALQVFIEADSWFASYQTVRAHPELLSAATEKQLAELIAAALSDGNQAAAATFHEYLGLLQRARAVGVAAAFAEKMETTAAELEAAAEAEDAAADMPPELRQAMDEIIAALEAEGVVLESPEDLERALAARPALRDKLGAAMRDTLSVSADEAAVLGAEPGDPLQTFVGAETWLASYQTVREHPELLSDAAEERLAGLVEQAKAAGNEPVARHFAEHLALLRRARTMGATQAFAEKMGTTAGELETAAQAETAGAGTPAKVRHVLREIAIALATEGVMVASPEDLEQALATRPALAARLAALGGATGDTPAMPERYRADVGHAKAAQDRYLRTGDLAALNEAAAAWERVLNDPAFPAAPERFQFSALNDAGTIILRRYLAGGRLFDLDRALALWNGAVARTPADSLERAAVLSNLGAGLRARYVRTGRPEDLDTAIAAWQDAVARTPADSPDRAGRLNNLGAGLSDRYARTGRPADLDAAITAYEDAVARTPADSPDRAGIQNNLGAGLRDRYARTGRPADLDAAIAAYEDAVARTPADSPDLAGHLNNLGIGLSDRYARAGRPADLDAAVAAWQDAVAHTPDDSPERASRLNNLGSGLRDRYARTGLTADLDAAIAAWQDAVARTPDDSPVRAGYLGNLGIGLHDRYARTGRPADLDAAIAAYEDAVAGTPDDSPERARRLNNLGNGLRDRYTRTGLTADLDAAIAAFEDAMARTPADSPELASCLNNLGGGLSNRYARMGRPADLDAAIAAWQDAAARTPADSPRLASIQTNLGGGLHDRYARTGRPEDLDAAIAAFEDAVASTPADSPRRAGYLSNLGIGLHDRCARTGRPEDLDAVVSAFKEAVARTPADSPERAGRLNNLGVGLSARYARTERPADLDAAIAAYEDAVARTPNDSPSRAAYLSNLGIGLSVHYARTGRPEVLNAAIAVHQYAVTRTPADSPDRASRVYNLGVGLSYRYARTGRPADLGAALGHSRAAATAATTGDTALRASRHWAGLALAHAAWTEALQAAAQGRATLRRLDEANVLAGERLSWRREVQGLAAAEAYAHARLDDPIAAVLALETGQAGQINAALGRGRDRELLDRLRGDDPALFAAYDTAAAEARAAQRAGGESWRDTPGARPDAAALRDRAAAAQTALDDVVARIAARPGYEALFAPPAFDDVAAAVGDAPLAYLATTPAGSVILLLHRAAAAPELLWAGLTSDELDRLLIRREQAAGNVGPVVGGLLPAQMGGFGLAGELAVALPALGERLMAPLAARLRELGATAVSLIPGGRLNLLPLHAATYQVDDRRRAFLDEFAVAFAPSGQSRKQGSGGVGEWGSEKVGEWGSGGEGALVVGNPWPLPAGVRSLHYAREEAEAVAGLLGGDGAFAGGVTPLYETDATLPAVAAALTGRRVLHFACHGTFDPAEPLDSGLLMAGGEMLTLRAVRDGAALAGVRLVVLSACQTGLTDFRELPDEVIGLPAGFLVAGAAGVVGSLWPVDDHSTALLMSEFYRRVLAGAPPAEALRAAQIWLRGVTWGELDAYYSLFLPRMSAPSAEAAQVEATRHNPRAAAYADPYHWAAFTFSGA